MAYRLFATRPSGSNSITFIWNSALEVGEVITSENNRFAKSGHRPGDGRRLGHGSRSESAGRIDLNFRLGDRLLFTNGRTVAPLSPSRSILGT